MSNDLMLETINCLRTTFKVTDNSERKAAETRLSELQKDLLTHFKVILESIKDPNFLENDIKLSIILYLKKSVKDRLIEKKLNPEHALEILKNIIDLLLTSNLSDICSHNFSILVRDILDYKQIADNKFIVNEIVINLYQYLEKLSNLQSYKSVIMILENVLLSSSVSHSNAIDILNKLFISIEFMLTKIIESFKLIDFQNQLNIFLSHIDICKLIFMFLHSSVTKTRSRLNIMNKIYDVFNNKFIPIAIQLTIMTIPNVLPNNFIAWSKDSNFDNSINAMKSKALVFINSVLQSKKEKIVENFLINQYKELIEASIRNLEFVVNDKFSYVQLMDKENENYPDYNYEAVIYQIILFLSRILIREPFINYFGTFANKFVVSIILPLLSYTQKELFHMKDDGEDYSNYISDIIYDHKSKTIKGVCAYILLTLSEKYNTTNLINYIISYCTELIDFDIKGSNIETISNYKFINVSDNIFKLLDAEHHIELSMLVFSILAPEIIRSDNTNTIVKEFFITHFNTIMSANSDIIKNRLAIFIGNFLDNFFTVNDERFSFCVEYLFMNLFSYKGNEGVAHECADALNELFSIKNISVSLQNLIGTYLTRLIDGIAEANFSLYFDVIHEIILNIEINEQILSLVQALTKKIESEVIPQTRIKFKTQNNNKYNLIVNKCFNIIRSITDKENYVVKYILYFENILNPLIEYMKNPARIDFDEDLVLIETSFIKYTKTIPNSALNVLPNLPKYLKKNKGLTLDLYELINQYLVYGNGIIDVNSDYNKIMIKIFSASFDRKCEYEKSSFLGACLMQIWLQNSPNLSEDIIKDILNLSFSQIKEIFSIYDSIEDLEREHDLYTFVALMVLIYSSFINYPIISFKTLISNNDLNKFIEYSQLMTDVKFFNTYLTKSIILGLCSVLKNEQVVKEVPDLVQKYLNLLLILLNKQKNEESKKLKAALKNEINCNFIDSDEEDDESEDENINVKINNINKMLNKDVEKILSKKMNIDDYDDYTNEKEIKEICDRTINPIKMIDEYEYYKNSIELLMQYDKNLFDSWINSLNDKQKEILNNIIHTRRINVSNNNFSANVPRKVVKIKRNTNI